MPHTVKPTPRGWPRVTPAVFYDDAKAAIAFLCRAFGFTVRIQVDGPDGTVVHSELELGDGVVMVSTAGKRSERAHPLPSRSPRAIGGAITQSLAIYVDDADAHCAQARAGGARIVEEPTTTDYGPEYWSDRGYRTEDPEGHTWWFLHRVRG